MKTKHILAAFALSGMAFAANAQVSSAATAQQTATGTATSFGTQVFQQNPADQHLSETIRNVAAPVLGAFAPNMSPLGCSSTMQGGGGVAGFSIVLGGPKTDHTCELEVAAGEMARQAYNTTQSNPTDAATLQKASMQIRCRINRETYEAMVDAGFDCKRKPAELESRTDTQPDNYKVH